MTSSRTIPLFDFNDVVQIVDTDGKVTAIDRLFGVVLGMAKDDSGKWSYMIDVYKELACLNRIDGWCIDEANLTSTGRSVDYYHTYSGSKVMVGPNDPLG